MTEKKPLIISISSRLLAAAFIAFGLYRGEMEIVFHKAVMVCMECIGLG
ncbi:MAG: hypothetical protein K6G19_05940 [Lachnospiraceae bacterium]|nr:hypothetical protein [Lachnospiraceae bacterium]